MADKSPHSYLLCVGGPRDGTYALKSKRRFVSGKVTYQQLPIGDTHVFVPVDGAMGPRTLDQVLMQMIAVYSVHREYEKTQRQQQEVERRINPVPVQVIRTRYLLIVVVALPMTLELMDIWGHHKDRKAVALRELEAAGVPTTGNVGLNFETFHCGSTPTRCEACVSWLLDSAPKEWLDKAP